jgi:folate-binding Fe-S cluster repair protein YgfZ
MAATTLTDRAIVRLSGDGAREFLQGLVTNDVTGKLPVWAGLLTPQGKCLFDFFVWGDRDDLLLDCEAEAANDLIKRLSTYRLRRKIDIARDQTLAVHWLPCGVRRPAQTGSFPVTSLVTSPCRNSRTPSPESRTIARSVRVVAAMTFS